MEFTLKSEYIELMKLLKFENLVQSGGEAKLVIDDGVVLVNGEVELRRRKKLRDGDIVIFEGNEIKVVKAAEYLPSDSKVLFIWVYELIYAVKS